MTTTRVPHRALAISASALVAPVAAAFWFPDWSNSGAGMLIWMTALIPAFLLSYYRGLRGVALALAGGMAVMTFTQVAVVALGISEPDWTILGAIILVYLAISGGIAILSEVLRRERQAAEEKALIDRLTGLPNRRLAEESMMREFAAAERGRQFSVVMFDMDHFKRVNDVHGHAAGDMTLQAFAMILHKNTRRENLSARYGGEEFIAALRETDAKSAAVFAGRVLEQMRTYQLPWGTQTVSAGIAQYRKGMGSYEMLIGEADRALYEAKASGRDRACIAAPHDEKTSTPGQPMVAVTELPAVAPGTPMRVCIVDDDPDVLEVLTRILRADGHTVWPSLDAASAITHCTEAPEVERPDVIVADVIMPAMTGMTMIERIMHLRPQVRVIYMSGYVQSEINLDGLPGAKVAFLEKPIDTQQLIQAVRRMSLDSVEL